jgi:hypothetical protein
MTISQRALAASQDRAPDHSNRDDLRELWRLAALSAARKKDVAGRMDEGRKILLSVLTKQLVDGGLAVSKAEMEARASQTFRDHVEAMHIAKLEADEAWIEAENQDRIYWAHVSHEATERAERRMTR